MSPPPAPSIGFVDPVTGDPLMEQGDRLLNPRTGRAAAVVKDGIPRFVRPQDNYAESFGFQWKLWHDTLSDSRKSGAMKYELLLKRTRFDQYATDGATLLECGMGGGDDTEALLRLPFREVHSFDLSSAVERARKYLTDPRLTLSQASIYEIPYPDHAFDFVFCHRVLQHTPDPVKALECVCRKVKPGGVLFAHSYKRSRGYMANYKYKVRWLSKRLPYRCVFWYVSRLGRVMRWLHKKLHRLGRVGRAVSFQFLPFDFFPAYGTMTEEQLLELDQLVTFDALTPCYDNPLTTRQFTETIEQQGFRIEHLHDPPVTPLWCTARRVR